MKNLESTLQNDIHPLAGEISLSPTLACHERCEQIRCAGKKVYQLCFGQSPFPPPESLVHEFQQQTRQYQYLPVRGLEELRRAIADDFSRQLDLPRSAEDVIVGPGTKALIYLLQMVVDARLSLPVPSWPTYAQQAKLLGRPIEEINTSADSHWQLTPDDLRRVWQKDPSSPRLLVINSPNNPTSTVYSNEQLAELADVCRQQRAFVISDEIYRELSYADTCPSIVTHYPDNTIVSVGLSKWSGAGGWRLGALIFPPRLRRLLNAVASVASEIYTTATAPIQYAAILAYQKNAELKHYLINCRRILRALTNRTTQLLRSAAVTIPSAGAGFYQFVDFHPLADPLKKKNIVTGEQLSQLFHRELAVALLPGSDFGLPLSSLTARLSCVDFDGARALDAARQIPLEQQIGNDFIYTYCQPVLEGVEKIVDWLTGNLRLK